MESGMKDKVKDVDGKAKAGKTGADDKRPARAVPVRERIARDGGQEACAFTGDEA